MSKYIPQFAERSMTVMFIKQIKYMFILTLCFMAIQAISVFGSQTPSQVANFSIAEGFDTTKDYEATFDATRVVSGTATKGANINISVYDPNIVVDGSYSKISNYDLVVGQSGIFRQTINLKLGKNYVVAKADISDVSYQTTINRKESQIQSDLDGIIVLPGQKYALKK